VQERLRTLLVSKQHDIAEQVAEMDAFGRELVRVADRLGLPAAAGACDETCGCLADDDAPVGEVPVALAGGRTEHAEAPIVCSLDAAERPARVAAWHCLAAHVVDRGETADGIWLRFDQTVSAPEIADLASSENDCCSFFRFEIHIAVDGTTLKVGAPPAARELVDQLFDQPQ
jgi:MerR family copper efflux transcriptional regulator